MERTSEFTAAKIMALIATSAAGAFLGAVAGQVIWAKYLEDEDPVSVEVPVHEETVHSLKEIFTVAVEGALDDRERQYGTRPPIIFGDATDDGWEVLKTW